MNIETVMESTTCVDLKRKKEKRVRFFSLHFVNGSFWFITDNHPIKSSPILSLSLYLMPVI